MNKTFIAVLAAAVTTLSFGAHAQDTVTPSQANADKTQAKGDYKADKKEAKAKGRSKKAAAETTADEANVDVTAAPDSGTGEQTPVAPVEAPAKPVKAQAAKAAPVEKPAASPAKAEVAKTATPVPKKVTASAARSESVV